jgi:hypothetical protein
LFLKIGRRGPSLCSSISPNHNDNDLILLRSVRSEWATADGGGDDGKSDQNSCEPCMPRSTPLPTGGHKL